MGVSMTVGAGLELVHHPVLELLQYLRVMVVVIRGNSLPSSPLKVRVNLREVFISYQAAHRTIITLRRMM
jgi:hypothetical protein